MKIIFILSIVLLLAGCSSLKEQSEGKIGCPASEMQISNDSGMSITGYRNWIVQCRGERFYCSTQPTGTDSSQTSCAPEVKQNQ